MIRQGVKSCLYVEAIYILCTALLIPFQRSFIYPVQSADFNDCDLSGTGMRRVSFQGDRALFTPGRSGRVIVFYHGNAETACNWRHLGAGFGQLGDAVLVVEYPFYATGEQVSGQSLSQERLYQTVDHVEQWITDQGFNDTRVVGYSLGAALASYHARAQQVSLVVLYAPFDRLISVMWDRGIYVPPAVLWDKYDNIAQLQQSRAKVIILHGGVDNVVSPKRSKALAQTLGDRLIRYDVDPALDHNVMRGAVFQASVRDLLTYSTQD